ncbi:hypothetical protein CAPI_05205 [Corynebacterium capitovis DSM 44611]|uniref:YbjN domain-containing protein n=1 Tax=Corynebacterium capitovis TaxID=131081 RepID=UPI00037CC2ED|nr:YbjN domain-containing protein [Corynebacterium capitovis]WKD57592.1 hypothetical protein CAPI_05205 [Corynebacterium capitovis DSM 44611]
MTVDEKRDNLAPADIEAVAGILREEGLEYRLEEGVLRTGFVNAAIVCARDGDSLIFEAIWRGAIPRDLAATAMFACNEYNQTHFAPTLRFFERGDEHLAVSAVRALNVTHGASFNQLGSFVVSSIQATLEAFDFLAATFPTLITWEDPHDEH